MNQNKQHRIIVTGVGIVLAGLIVLAGFRMASSPSLEPETQEEGMAANPEAGPEDQEQIAARAESSEPDPDFIEPAEPDVASQLAALSGTPWSLEELTPLVTGMKQVNMPDFLIRSMVQDVVLQRLLADSDAFSDVYPPIPDIPEHPSREIMEVAYRRNRILDDVLGSRTYGWTEEHHQFHRQNYGEISVERFVEIEPILLKHQHEFLAGMQRGRDPKEHALLHVVVLDSLRPILSPEELIQFELHQMSYGQVVRRSLPDEEMPAEEIRRLLDAALSRYVNRFDQPRP